jgi:hypothetical protein
MLAVIFSGQQPAVLILQFALDLTACIATSVGGGTSTLVPAHSTPQCCVDTHIHQTYSYTLSMMMMVVVQQQAYHVLMTVTAASHIYVNVDPDI